MRAFITSRLRVSCTLCVALGTAACSAESGSDHGQPAHEQPPGSIVLGLRPVSGVRIDSVHYAVTQHMPTNLIREGTLPTLGSGAAFAVGLELPRGSGYRLNRSGVSVEGGTFLSCTGSVGPFSIAPGITPFLELDLTCVNNTSGSLSPGLAIETEACPQVDISQVTALPAIAEVSSTIELVVAAQDAQGRNPSYAWSLEDPSLGSLQDAALRHASPALPAPRVRWLRSRRRMGSAARAR